MFEKQERTGLIVKLYYNRDGKKLQSGGDVLYHYKKCRDVQLQVDSDKADQVMEDLKKERYVKKVLPCHLKDLDTDFVGSLQRLEAPSLVTEAQKTQSFDGLRFFY